MTVRELAAPAGIRQRLEGTIRDHLHLLIPAAFHRQLESFEPGNYLDFEAGYSIEAPEDEGELAIRSLAITADREELGGLTLKLWISTPHPALARQLVITDDGGCWQEDRDYLFAELGTFWGNRTLSSCLVEAIGRGRSLLRAPSQGHWPGLWLRVRQDEIAGNRMQGRVDELWTALEVASRVSDAARDLSRHWLLRIQELLGQKRCKRVSHHHGGSFFVDDGAFQVGAWIQPGDKGRHVAGWVYFRERRRRDLFAAAMERQGWRLDQDNDPKTVVVVPYLSEGTTLDLPLVDELAATLATTIDEVMR